MAIDHESFGRNRLTIAERIELVQDLWESIAVEAEAPPLSEDLRLEIDRRLAAHQSNPGAAIPWERVEAE